MQEVIVGQCRRLLDHVHLNRYVRAWSAAAECRASWIILGAALAAATLRNFPANASDMSDSVLFHAVEQSIEVSRLTCPRLRRDLINFRHRSGGPRRREGSVAVEITGSRVRPGGAGTPAGVQSLVGGLSGGLARASLDSHGYKL